MIYECPRCLSQAPLDQKAEHDQYCFGSISENAREIAQLCNDFSEDIEAGRDTFLVAIFRMECSDCHTRLMLLAASAVIVMKCNHSICKSCMDAQIKDATLSGTNEQVPHVLCKKCFTVTDEADTIDSLSLHNQGADMTPITPLVQVVASDQNDHQTGRR